MKITRTTPIATLAMIATASPALASEADRPSIPSVVVEVENLAPERGTFMTPVWMGLHDGTFDIYDRGVSADALLGPGVLEALAEDGNNGPITETFELRNPGQPQANLTAPGGPFQPGSRAAITFQVDPYRDRYFSYGSMVIPSNDFFVANGNPLAHLLFDDGIFVGGDFIVSGAEVLDAGTESNNEVASETAFLNQGGPNIGPGEGGVVLLGQGFAAPGALTYPNGILNHPALARSDFTASGYRTLGFRFRFIDLGLTVRFSSDLSSRYEVAAELVDSDGFGSATLFSREGRELSGEIEFINATGPLLMAHLHLGQAGTNGPVVVDLGAGIRNGSVVVDIDADDVVGPLANAADPFQALLNEMAAGNIYINLHTQAFPAGEMRGQIRLDGDVDGDEDEY